MSFPVLSFPFECAISTDLTVRHTPVTVCDFNRFYCAICSDLCTMADPDKKTVYEQAAKAKHKPVFSLTVADFFNALVVDEVDPSEYGGAEGDTIIIRAHDDFKEARLQL